MSDYLSETPNCATAYCPACEPDRDPLAEILVSVPCHRHQERAGADDAAVSGVDYVSYGEAGGESNRSFCALFHRGRT